MNNLINGLKDQTTITATENGAITYSTTLNANLDLFFQGGAMRAASEERIVDLFAKAFIEDRAVALANLWHLRDIRSGKGEKRISKTIFKFLAENYSHKELNLDNIVEYGCYKDLLCLLDTPLENIVLDYIQEQLTLDINSEHPTLLAKWLPSCNTSSKESRRLASKVWKACGFKNTKEYRKTLSSLRTRLNIIEKLLSEGKMSEIEYSKVPSRAMMQYKKAFRIKDAKRFENYLESVKKGEKKINVGNILPNEIVKRYIGTYRRPDDDGFLSVAWDNLKNVFGDVNENALVVADVSSSMSGEPMNVSIGLAMYIAERNKGVFHNYFMTFSDRPSLQEVKGADLFEKVANLARANWSMSTNLELMFKTILDVALDKKLPQEELPQKLYIISDMEFNQCVRNGNVTNFENAKQMYSEAGYKLPDVVFWNVNSRQNNCPVRHNDQGVALISGYSPNVMKAVIGAEDLTPMGIMLKTLNKYFNR